MACKSIITHIQPQAEKVIARHEKLEAEMAEVCRERDRLQAELRREQEQVRELKEEIKRLQLAKSLAGNSADNKKSRARINLLLREVDKCIELLSKAE